MFQSTRPVRGATAARSSRAHLGTRFNPRAPCGARPTGHASRNKRKWFQSTRPVRGATLDRLCDAVRINVSIHAPRAGRDMPSRNSARSFPCFNPRAPCGARQNNTEFTEADYKFQSTRPVRGATRLVWDNWQKFNGVSIHAPRAGRDPPNVPSATLKPTFQSTRPVRGATSDGIHQRCRCYVSIHAPRAGRDSTLILYVDS